MKALVVYCHPCPESFSAAIRDTVVATLTRHGAQVRIIDLYTDGFHPVMDADERRRYHDAGINEEPIRDQLDHCLWCDTLIFVYPTWWYGLPAMLKGWLDRVWVPHVTFKMPTETTPIRPNMLHIKRLAAVTTCGATWWMSKLIGEPGRRTILRGIRALCDPRCRCLYLAQYEMDTTTSESRHSFLQKVDRKMSAFLSSRKT